MTKWAHGGPFQSRILVVPCAEVEHYRNGNIKTAQKDLPGL